MKTEWFVDRDASNPALEYLRSQLSPHLAWHGEGARALWLMWFVARVPSLAKRCRWVAAELARQFAIYAMDTSGVKCREVEALRYSAPIVDGETARAAADAAHLAAGAANTPEVHAAAETAFAAHAAARSAGYEDDSDFYVSDCASRSAECASYTDEAYFNGAKDEDPRLAALVRAAIPWEWVSEACAVDAPELLEVAST